MSENKGYEETLKELEEIVLKIEKGEISLDETVALYEKGVGLSKKCSEFLDKAEQKISILKKNADGSYVKENFENGDE